MKFAFINNFSKLLLEFDKLNFIARIDDNLLLLELQKRISSNYQRFFIDLKPYANNIFTSQDNISQKSYRSPFDIALAQLNNSALVSALMDGSNKILILTLLKKGGYKEIVYKLHIELTNRYTNAILTDEEGRIISALKYLKKNSRQILKGALLPPLPQPIKPYEVKEFDRDALIVDLSENCKKGFFAHLEQRKKRALDFIDKKISALVDSKNALDSYENLMQKSAKMRAIADILMANRESFVSYKKEQIFSKERIFLEKEFSSINEATEYFYSKSKRLRKKALGISKERAFLESRIDVYVRQREVIKDTTSPEELEIFGIKNLKKQELDKKMPLFIQGYKFSMGRNERENQALLESAKGNDIWMHARDLPGSHGILHCGKNAPSRQVISSAAKLLAKLNSKNKVSVDYTLRKFVKLKGGAQVSYSKHKTLHFD